MHKIYKPFLISTWCVWICANYTFSKTYTVLFTNSASSLRCPRTSKWRSTLCIASRLNYSPTHVRFQLNSWISTKQSWKSTGYTLFATSSSLERLSLSVLFDDFLSSCRSLAWGKLHVARTPLCELHFRPRAPSSPLPPPSSSLSLSHAASSPGNKLKATMSSKVPCINVTALYSSNYVRHSARLAGFLLAKEFSFWRIASKLLSSGVKRGERESREEKGARRKARKEMR